MRCIMFIILSLFSVTAICQRIEFRNDSLFVNSYYVSASTQKITLDSLLKTKGKEKRYRGKDIPGTVRSSGVQYLYPSKGLRFTKRDSDTAKLSIGVKLHRNSNPDVDQNNMPGRTFTGEMFIAGNYMNDKRQVVQLQQLKECKLLFNHESTMGYLFYQQRKITVLFEFRTDQATCIFIN